MGEQKNICTFEQRNCAELNHVDEIPWAKDRPGLLWYKNNIKSDLEIQRTKRVKRIRLRRIQNPYGTCETIRGCHNRDKGTAENERLRNPKFIFSYPKNERLIFLGGRNAAQGEISTMRVGDSQRTGVRTYPLFVLAEMLMKKLSGIVGKIYE